MSNPIYLHDFTYFADSGQVQKICTILKKLCKKWIFQLEKAPSTGSLHYQGFVNLQTKMRTGELASLLSGLGMPGVSCRPCSSVGKSSLQMYCMKEDTRVDGPWADHYIYTGQDLIKDLLPWQQTVCDLLSFDPHPRHIHWIYDAEGGMGKSSLAKHLYFHQKVPTLTVTSAKDLLHCVSKFQNRKMYIVDIARTLPEGMMKDMYFALECLKNGFFVSGKYDSSMICMRTPHVIVFSNMLPKMSSLSADRWRIYDTSSLRWSLSPGISHVVPNVPKKIIY
jgi:hypothetical protein